MQLDHETRAMIFNLDWSGSVLCSKPVWPLSVSICVFLSLVEVEKDGITRLLYVPCSKARSAFNDTDGRFCDVVMCVNVWELGGS